MCLHINSEPWPLWLGEEKLIKEQWERLQEHIYSQHALQYWEKIVKLGGRPELINWVMLEKMNKRGKPGKTVVAYQNVWCREVSSYLKGARFTCLP
jgi:hypothetical protein